MSDHIKAPGSAGRFSSNFPLLQQRRSVEQWPPADRAAWELAMAHGGPFTAAGPAAHLAPTTRRARTGGYGQFLSFLDAIGQLHEEERPEQRVTLERLGGYIASLQERVSPRTVQQQVRELRCVLQAMYPSRDWGWVIRHPAVPSAADVRGTVSSKPALDLRSILDAALAQLQALQRHPQTIRTARDYRDLLLVALTVCRPLRRRNLAAMRIDQNLLDEGDRFRLVFTEIETKNGVVIDQLVPQALVLYLQHYLIEVRSFLLGGEKHDSLWVGQGGKPLGYGALHRCFERIGLRLTGRGFSVHGFRHAVASMTVEHDPRDIDLAASVLGHKSNRSVNEVYDRSGRHSGVLLWQRLRQKLQADGAAELADD